MSTKRFETLVEIEEYFSHDRLMCLECGRTFLTLGQHIKVHGLDDVSYREKFNIPPKFALACKSSRDKMAAAQKTILENNPDKLDMLAENRAKAPRGYAKFNALFKEVKDAANRRNIKEYVEKDIPKDILLAAHEYYKDHTAVEMAEKFGYDKTTLIRHFAKNGLKSKLK